MATPYDVITDHILSRLSAGTVPWRKPWRASTDMPRSIHGRAYRGINVFLLLFRGYTDPRWLTFKQANAMGGRVRKGEKGTPVVLWHPMERLATDEETGETKKTRTLLLRYYTVFNVEQCEGLDVKALPVEKAAPDPIEAAEAIVEGYLSLPNHAPIAYDGGSRAYYVPATDSIHLPKRATFETAEGFYGTAFHEMGHSTGHASRLNRDGVETFDHFGSDRYGREELVAEMTAAFLSGEAGIEPATIDNAAAYVASWMGAIKEDPKAVVFAAARAQKAADYILGRLAEQQEAEPEHEAQAA